MSVRFGWAALIVVCALAAQAKAYDAAFEKTPVDKLKVLTVPAGRWLVTSGQGNYFEQSNQLFRRLFRYISDNDVKMTVPVTARLEPATMAFYAGKNAKKALSSTAEVEVVDVDANTVVAIGARGGYTRENVAAALDKLEKWLAELPGYKAAGEPYAVFWNGPFVPNFLKRFEVHIPVEKTGD